MHGIREVRSTTTVRRCTLYTVREPRHCGYNEYMARSF